MRSVTAGSANGRCGYPRRSEGAYFIKESLNEYMTLLFVHATAGGEVFHGCSNRITGSPCGRCSALLRMPA